MGGISRQNHPFVWYDDPSKANLAHIMRDPRMDFLTQIRREKVKGQSRLVPELFAWANMPHMNEAYGLRNQINSVDDLLDLHASLYPPDKFKEEGVWLD